MNSHNAPLPRASRLVICGSMAFYPEMLRVRCELDRRGLASILPDAEDDEHVQMSAERYAAFKVAAAEAHARRIRHPQTFGILVLNFFRHGIKDYIGPTTFAEIVLANASRKRIYVLNGFPAMYADQLRGWNACCLSGELELIVGNPPRSTRAGSLQGEMFAGA